MNISFIREKINLFLVCFIITIVFSKQKYIELNLNSPYGNNNFEYLSVVYEEYKWIPSLLYPTLLVLNEYVTEGYKEISQGTFFNPLLTNEGLDFALFIKKDFIKEITNIALAKNTGNTDKENYIGLSFGYSSETVGLNQENIFLFYLTKSNQIEKEIFSFSKWELKNNLITSTLYLGDMHENFKSNNGIIGSCKNSDDTFWGCSFNEMIFNDGKKISLMNSDNKLYKIYFISDNYDIIFPKKFEDEFKNKTDHKCNYENQEFKCEGFFNEKDYTSLKLVNDDMNITLEVDNLNRYRSNDNSTKEKTRIKFKKSEVIIFPLIMFKQFHVQFDAQEKVISFYTTDNSILQVKESPKNNPDTSTSSSSIGTVFLAILIILLILALLFGAFYFIKKRRDSNVEKNINRFTKFEDEEDFKDMNEKKVY